MDRRTFIKGAVISAATPGVVASGDGVEHSTLLALIAKHENLYASDDKAWGRVYDLDDSEAMMNAPRPTVQVGRLLVGRNSEGENIFKPIMVASEGEIEAEYGSRLQQTEFMTRGYAPIYREAAFQKLEASKQAKLAEFRECVAAKKRYEDECGYTAAMTAARASAEEVKAVEQLIIAYVPASLEEAATKARWVVKKMNDDRSYLLDHEGALEEALAAIGRA